MQVLRRQAQIAPILAALVFAGCATQGPTEVKESPFGTVLVFSDLRGTLKPCGCSPDLRRGGVDRVAEHVRAVRKGNPAALLLHAGDLLLDDEGAPKGREGQISRRTQAVARSLKIMGLNAATLGQHDLNMGMDWLEKHLPDVSIPLVATNTSGERWARLVKKTLMVKAGPLRIGLIGLLPSGEGVTEPGAAVRQAVPRLRDEGADVILVLSSLGLRKGKRLLRKVSGVDLFLAAGQDLKAVVSGEVEGFNKAWLFQSFVQGGQVGRVDVRKDGAGRLVYRAPDQPVPDRSYFSYGLTPIEWTLPQHPEVAAEMAAYNLALKEINLASVGKLPELNPGQASYVGATQCLECHEDARAFYEKDQHTLAWETLEKEGKTFDLECVSCHVTGYGEPGGSILGDLKNLTDVQCESCHGPGSLHSEDGDTDLIRREVPASQCVGCHNEKHSTGFDYDTYRLKIMVPGHGKPLN